MNDFEFVCYSEPAGDIVNVSLSDLKVRRYSFTKNEMWMCVSQFVT